MPLCFEQSFTVPQWDCDPWDRMTPGAVLRRVQEISNLQCESLGLNQEHYQQTRSLFLLSRLSLQVTRMPAIWQPLRMQTRAYGVHRAVYQRVTTLYAENGSPCCEVDARWVLVNTDTRHIYRREPAGFRSPFAEPPGAEGHDFALPAPAAAPQTLAELQASYTLCDRNGHLNNTRYADLMCDLLPLQELAAAPVRKMLLFYKAEIPLGQIFVITGEKLDKNGTYFCALQNERKSFEGAAWI